MSWNVHRVLKVSWCHEPLQSFCTSMHIKMSSFIQCSSLIFMPRTWMSNLFKLDAKSITLWFHSLSEREAISPNKIWIVGYALVSYVVADLARENFCFTGVHAWLGKVLNYKYPNLYSSRLYFATFQYLLLRDSEFEIIVHTKLVNSYPQAFLIDFTASQK